MNKREHDRSRKRPAKFFVPFYRRILAFCLVVCIMGCFAACRKTDLEKEIALSTARKNQDKKDENADKDENAESEKTRNRGKTEDGKQIITLGIVATNLDEQMLNAIKQFNNKNENYSIEIVNYSEGLTYGDLFEEVFEKYKLDMLTGKGTDIIYLSHFGFGPTLSMQKGLVEDLYPYLEQSDVVKKEDLNASVLRAYEVDGKLPCMPTNFIVSMNAVRTSDIGNVDEWSSEDVIALMNSKPEGTKLLYTEDKMNVLAFLMSDTENYFNRATGECHFDSAEFKRILEFSNRFPDEYDYSSFSWESNEPSEKELFASGKLLVTRAGAGDFTDIQVDMPGLPENITFIGDPRKDGKCGSSVFGWNMYGIYSQSEHKEGAWEFIESLQTDAFQIACPLGLPIRNSAYEFKLEVEMTPHYVYDKEGNPVLDATGNPEEVPIDHYNDGIGTEMDIYAVTQEEADIVAEMISKVTENNNWNDSEAIWNIIEEEAAAYFCGQKSVDEVASIIQSRVSIYVMEQM